MSGYDEPAGWPAGFSPPQLPEGALEAPGTARAPGLAALNARGWRGRRSRGGNVPPPPPQPVVHPPVQTVSHLGEPQQTGAPSSGGGMGLPANMLVPGPPAREG